MEKSAAETRKQQPDLLGLSPSGLQPILQEMNYSAVAGALPPHPQYHQFKACLGMKPITAAGWTRHLPHWNDSVIPFWGKKQQQFRIVSLTVFEEEYLQMDPAFY